MRADLPLWQHGGEAESRRSAIEELMSAKTSYSTPMLHVMDIEGALAFL